MYKDRVKRQAENPNSPTLTYRQMITELSKTSGIGQRTISMTLSEYKKQGTVSSPNRKKKRSTVVENVDDFDKNAIRRKIHDFWFNCEIPTFLKILTAVNEDESLPTFKRSSFQRVLKDLNFVHIKTSQNSALLERDDIVNWRRNYLEHIRHYRQQNRQIYYLDETWISADDTTNKSSVDHPINSPRDAVLGGLTTGRKEPAGKGKRIMLLHIGSSDGFVPGGLLCFESKANSSACHDEISGNTFYEWFVKTLPLLKKKAVIVMDSASCHSVKKYPIPVMSWKKKDIVNWLENKGVIIDHRTTVKAQLLEKVKILTPQYDQYVIDEFAKENDLIVLRLPPHHCELNPIELAFSSVKHYVRMNNSSSEPRDVQELLIRGVEHVTTEMWTDFERHVMKEEGKLWDIDFISDAFLDEQPEHDARRLLKIETSDTSSDSDS